MSAGFTPGPWEALKGASPTDDMRCAVVAVRDDYRYLVATIENGAPGDICDTEFANARLIAAAPELYEALADCMKRLRACATNAGNADFAVDALCEQFEAPLRKARGEQ